MRKPVIFAALSAIVAVPIFAQAGNRLDPDCRREVLRLCGMNREGMRDCLAQNGAKLSPQCFEDLSGRMRDRMRKAEADAGPKFDAQAASLGALEKAYGSDPMQTLDFYRAVLPQIGGVRQSAPVIVFVHGGGWSRGDKRNATGIEKIKHFTGNGYHLASIDYRLVPNVTVDKQADDVASAIAYLRRNALELGIDVNRIVLMGHSAGAHLSALVGSDPKYLRRAGLDYGALAGVVPIDGAAYDVPAQMKEGARIMQSTYVKAFGTDPAVQKDLSPYWHAEGPNVASFLILHADRADGKRQSEALRDALRKGGSNVQLNGFPGTGMQGHADINRKLGDPAYPATPVVDAWLKAVLGN